MDLSESSYLEASILPSFTSIPLPLSVEDLSTKIEAFFNVQPHPKQIETIQILASGKDLLLTVQIG